MKATGFLVLMIFYHFLQAQHYEVALVPVGKVDSTHVRLAQFALEDYYDVKVYVQDAIEIRPEFITKFDTILNASAINEYLAEHFSSANRKVIGVTDWAITIGNMVSMLIRGLAIDIGGSSAVASSYKVLLEAKADPTSDFDTLFSKVARHEFGHTLDLEHCEDDHCLMTFGHNFSEANSTLCLQCAMKVQL